MDIEKTIREFVDYVGNQESSTEEDLGKLIELLDKLAYPAYFADYSFDETDYPDAPSKEYQKIRDKIEKRFPSLGFYNVPENISDNLENTGIMVSDAFDDLSDIIGDLYEVIWCFENTSRDDALWHFQNSYTTHWGRHLRELQLYLHDRWW